jgi:hypothetical protein
MYEIEGRTYIIDIRPSNRGVGDVRAPETVLAPGRSRKHRKPESALVLHRLAPDDTPEGLAPAVPYVAVFEVTPA